MRNVFVTGAAGYIGSNAVDRLLSLGYNVTGYDNLSTGFEEFLSTALKNPRFKFVRGDVLDFPRLTSSMAGADWVWHLSANADVRFGLEHPKKDLEQNTIATFNVLEAMRANGARKMVFSSTGSVYGETPVVPTPETAPFPVQTSLYGASKVAGEGMIQAYCEGFGFEALIFRFVSILGPRYTHGHVIDFYRKLLADPRELKILGNGKQKKSYLHVHDCLDGILHVSERPMSQRGLGKLEIYNIGTTEYSQVTDSIGWISEAMGVKPQVIAEAQERGWIGDVPFIFLDTKKIEATGWKPKRTIRESIVDTLKWLTENRWVLERRE